MADSVKTLEEQLFEAFLSDDNQKVADVIDKMKTDQVNVKNGGGLTALHWACSRNNNRALTLLLNKVGIDVNAKSDRSGATPLHIACTYDNHEAVTQLLDRPDTNPNARTDNYGKTPIMVAARFRCKEALRVMLASPRVDLNLKDNDGRVLEDLVGLGPKSQEEEKKQCLDMIKQERLKRVNQSKNEKQKGIMESRRLAIEKIEGINQEIEDAEQRSLEEVNIRKLKRKDLDERHSVERGRLAKKQRDEEREIEERYGAERERLSVKQRNEKSEMEAKLAGEDEANEKLVQSLKEKRQDIAKDIVKINSGPSHEASKDDKANLEAARETLECLVCLETMKPPTKIWACPNSHAVCEPCKENLVHQNGGPHPPCPTCKTEKVNQRALMVEKIAASLFRKNK